MMHRLLSSLVSLFLMGKSLRESFHLQRALPEFHVTLHWCLFCGDLIHPQTHSWFSVRRDPQRGRTLTLQPPQQSFSQCASLKMVSSHGRSHLGYNASMIFWKLVVNIFFREIRLRGAFNIPIEGPVIFVGAPHANQVCCHESPFIVKLRLGIQ